MLIKQVSSAANIIMCSLLGKVQEPTYLYSLQYTTTATNTNKVQQLSMLVLPQCITTMYNEPTSLCLSVYNTIFNTSYT